MTDRRKIAVLFRVLSALALLWAGAGGAARAQATFTLSPSPATITGAGVIPFAATLTNVGTETIANLTGFGGTAFDGLTWDDIAFNTDLPDSLAPSSSYAGTLYLNVAAGTPAAVYSIEYGVFGIGAATGSLYLPFADVSVEVLQTVESPEPTSGLLLSVVCFGMASLGIVGVVGRKGKV